MAGRIWRFVLYACGGGVLLGGLVGLLGSGWLGFRLFQLEWNPQGRTDLRMHAVALPFSHEGDISDRTGSLPFMAGVVLDVDGDFRDEVFLGGGRGQDDGLFRFDADKGGFTPIAGDHDLAKAPDDATMGGAALDIDGDGTSDLLLARESGLWLYLNRAGRLAGGRLPLALDPTTIPLSAAFADLNRDGHADIFVSGYIRNDLVEGQTIFVRPYGGYSHLFLSTGPLTWRDASQDYGVWRQHNTFTALFADLDEDRDSDLVVAQDTGRVELYENSGAPPLRRVENPSVNSYPMGAAAGDFNGDGRLDLYFSNVGPTLPEALLRGDLPREAPFNSNYMLFENRGALRFEDVAARRGVGRVGFGWGVVAADMDLDGWEDLLVAQNYAKFGRTALVHRYGGRLFRNDQGERFRPVEARAGVANPLFAIAPLIGDFDGDNLPDLVWANLNGPARAFLNRSPQRKAITLRLDDDVASVNARILVEVGGHRLVRHVVGSQGLASDQTAKIMIGLGGVDRAERVSILFQDGHSISAETIQAGAVLDWRRGGT